MTLCAYCDLPITASAVRWVGEPYHGWCLDFIASDKQRRAEVALAAIESRNRIEAVLSPSPFLPLVQGK